MPKYTFVCDACVIEFDRNLKMDQHLTHPCPSCTGAAPRLWEAAGISFNFADSPNGSPANSGVHKEDYPTADHLIGKDADKRWGMINEREKVKNAARVQGDTHALIRTGTADYLDYEPMSDTGLNARRRLAKATLDAIRQQKARP